jgi:hypothetical protein
MRVCVVAQEETVPYLEAILTNLTNILNAICRVSFRNYKIFLKKYFKCINNLEPFKTPFQSLFV